MIYLPPPQPILNKEIRISGDVEIHPSASLAPGVILQAAASSRIVIGADVCIGMGVIINACQGSVEIGDGAILGSGVLIIGESKIGNNSCIGTSTTIFRQDIKSMAVVEPGSIIGDLSRPATPNEEQGNNIDQQQQEQGSQSDQNAPGIDQQEQEQEEQGSQSNHKTPGLDNNIVTDKHPKPPAENTEIPQVETMSKYPVEKSKDPVVGQVYINELLITLFPHKKDSSSG